MNLMGGIDDGQDNLQIEAKPWDRQPGESAKAFRAFAIYRDKGAERTYEFVAAELCCSGANARRWAKQWNWVERSRQYDIYIDRAEQEQLSRGRVAMKKRMAKQGIAMQTVAANALVELQQRLDRKEQPTQLSASEITKLAEVGSKLERYGRGDEEEEPGTLEIRVRIEDPPAESAEDLAAARAAIESALRGR